MGITISRLMTKYGLVSPPRLSKYDMAVAILGSAAMPQDIKDACLSGLSASNLYRLVVLHPGTPIAHAVLFFVGKLVRARKLWMPTPNTPDWRWSDAIGDEVEVDHVVKILNTDSITAILRDWADGEVSYKASADYEGPVPGEVPSLKALCMGQRDWLPKG